MAHLTHAKDDPAYRDTETDLAKIDEPQLQPASSHTKANKPRILDGDVPVYDAPARSRSPNYGWVRGVVHSTHSDGSERCGSSITAAAPRTSSAAVFVWRLRRGSDFYEKATPFI